DLLLNCTGGTPTPAGQTIPLSNLTIFLNTNITSRIVGPVSGGSEAEVLIDEPFPVGTAQVPASAPVPANSPTQGYCAVSTTNASLNGCGLLGTAGGVGAQGPYKTTNIFQGLQVSANSVAWLGLPIDAPGTNAVRTIRITNVRGNACQLGTSSTLIPTQIVMFVSVNGSQQVSINNPQQTVAFIQPGLVVGGGTTSFLQCQNANGTLLSSSASVGQTNTVSLTATEGFASSFKARGYLAGGEQPSVSGANSNTIGTRAATLQNVPGFPYNTESGFVSAATGGPATGAPGVADFGTRLGFNVNNLGAGVNIFVPTTIALTNAITGNASGGIAILVSGASGSGALAGVTISGTSASVQYEIVQANPNAIEKLSLPVTVSFLSNTGQNLPGLGQSTGTVGFLPQSTVNTATSSDPIPRFCPGPTRNLFAVNACSCNLLFPFVTNQAGFDTGVAIANTSLDPFGTATQAGTVTLNYYGNTTGGGAAPAAQTSQTVNAGTELVFTLSNGGNLGVAATPGFQGYIISTARFQYCHAFAFISDLGAQKLAEGYVAIQLDVPSLNRTGQAGENEGH
ncbi:MAG: hypothetical protein M3Y27_22560, partial [Acidobacteriota bacterium]|nr:hypothetical protein [Acidobacteriota bacterium]